MKQPCVYIITNKQNGVLYTGVTFNLIQRTYQHQNGLLDGFSKKYNCKLLVWYEPHPTMESAIMREKQIKGGNRARKVGLIESMNPGWRDLNGEIVG